MVDSFDEEGIPINSEDQSREVRIINRNFSLGEYDESWTKVERYLFIEIYNVIKEFYLSKKDTLIQSFSDESITVKLPVYLLDKKLFDSKNRSRQLRDAADGLMNKRIKYTTEDEDGQFGFDFITMFPRIRYMPKEDKKHMYIRIPSEVFEEMVPIESFCQLDLLLLAELNSGNTIRLYEIFKSYAFRREFSIEVDELRKKLGFFEQGKYKEWKYFNNQVLKPAVQDINDHKQYDIEVEYEKARGKDVINFKIITHAKLSSSNVRALSLDARINPETQEPNMIQRKYIATTLKHCQSTVVISDPNEMNFWIITDLIRQQEKQGEEFNFKRSMNAISKQIREGKYTQPYSHRYRAIDAEIVFNDEAHEDIKNLYNKNKLDEIREKYSDEQLKAYRFGYLIDMFLEEDI